jgi:hypothetical protein
VVFDYGRAPFPEGAVTPIRFIHFEPQRIVIDVAGPSAAITPIFDHLKKLVADVKMPDGGEVIGEPTDVRDYSEVTVRVGIPPERVLAPGIAVFFREQFDMHGDHRDLFLVPRLAMQVLPGGQEYRRPDDGDVSTFRLELRTGTQVEDLIFFSGAPLDSVSHARYLEQLANRLSALQQ